MFRIYYHDGSFFEATVPEDVPHGFVTAIASNDANGVKSVGRQVLAEYEIYIYSDGVGGWHGTDKYADLMNHLSLGCGHGGVRAVLPGLWINTAHYRGIVQEARTATGLKPKSANNPVLEDGRQ